MSQGFSESVVEGATPGWLESLRYSVRHGCDIGTGTPIAERCDLRHHDVVLFCGASEG